MASATDWLDASMLVATRRPLAFAAREVAVLCSSSGSFNVCIFVRLLRPRCERGRPLWLFVDLL